MAAKMASNARNKVRVIVWKRCGGRCEYCGAVMTKESMTLDHWIPRSKGGTNAARNLRGSCQPCNEAKADKHPLDEIFSALESELRRE
jgi:5-methylcytosine-specific restriction endonuclease McrA